MKHNTLNTKPIIPSEKKAAGSAVVNKFSSSSIDSCQ
jgi:hypothetical protein